MVRCAEGFLLSGWLGLLLRCALDSRCGMSLNLDEFQRVVEAVQQADAVKADLKRALRKVTGAVQALQGALGEMEKALADEYVATPRQRKPCTPQAVDESADGAPCNKPGRPKKTA
jgi:hypothetical protein